MQREIKFRGQRVDNSEWVFGYFVKAWDNSCYIITEFGPDVTCCSDCGANVITTHEVIPETVEQYTGLKDKNGKEIYEGDVCNCREYECFGKIKWNNDEAAFFFCIVCDGGGYEEEWLYEYADELEVIGDIYENPELLEVTE